MTRGTTPVLGFDVYGETLEDCTVWVTIKQGGQEVINIKDPDIQQTSYGCHVAVRLTQEQTLKLKPGGARAQIRYVDSNGLADAGDELLISVKDVLKDGVIKYEGSTQ